MNDPSEISIDIDVWGNVGALSLISMIITVTSMVWKKLPLLAAILKSFWHIFKRGQSTSRSIFVFPLRIPDRESISKISPLPPMKEYSSLWSTSCVTFGMEETFASCPTLPMKYTGSRSSLTRYTRAQEHKWRMKNEMQIPSIILIWHQASPACHGKIIKHSLFFLHFSFQIILCWNCHPICKNIDRPMSNIDQKTWPHQFIHLDLNHSDPSYFSPISF